MSKEIYISSTPHETRLAIVEDEALTEIYYERENEYTLAGSIYNGRVTRVLPGMQSSFVDIGLERDAFLYITDFMEETPDPEEFDTASTGDRTPRSITGGSERASGEGSRGADRGDRGGRGRRGGRDRDRNLDRQGASDLAPRQPGAEREQSDRNLPLAAEPAVPAGDSAEATEIGEGAPGADGSRRWRGRRGRRRGRGPGSLTGDQPQENSTPAYTANDSSFDEEPYIEIDGAAAQPPAERADESQRERSGDRGRRDDRGGRRRDGQRFDGPRRDQGQPTPQAPRGFTPSRDLYGVDSGQTSITGPIANAYPDSDAGPVAEPLILPGESLSKYRKGNEPEAPSAAAALTITSVSLAPPANLYTLAEGWDGGAVLPGETIRRRSESRPELRSDDRGSSRRDRDSDRGSHRENRSERYTQIVAPVIEQQASATATEPVQETSFIPAPETIEASAPLTSEEVVKTVPEAQLQPTEYEPSDASASYRVDPLLRSEYRQSAPVLEPPAEPVPQTAETARVEEDVVPNLAHSITPAPDQQAEKLHSDVLSGPEELPVPAVGPHDITAISATGEMHSEPAEVLTEVPAHPAPMEVPEPASPIRHEGAVVSDESTSEIAVPAAASFAPGTGQLDEEVLEEDDLEGSTFHASSIEEMEDEDIDEEALEGAADLGTMLREMSIDQITRTAPEIEDQDGVEEDDFEEDDLDEDELEEQESDELESELEQSEESNEDMQEQTARTGTAADQQFFEDQFGQNREENRGEPGEVPSTGSQPQRHDSFREGDRRGGRRDGRRDGRRGRSDRGDRSSSSSEHERSGHSNGRGRHSMQSTNLPAISDLLKPGQEILVQIAKEPIAKKGARITSHIALPGRFLVFMPTVNHTGVSRKIESDGERRRLKEILLSEKGDATGGFIVRTAAEGASEEELRSDLRFLLNLWADIKARSESSKSPALIYHDLNLIERILRDQVTDNFSAIWVDSEIEYERVLRFLQRFQPSLIRRVKLYSKDTPLFEQFGITEEINKALRSKVWLKSGGSIVINQTEALVAIDINTGKFVGKTARLEDTIVKTNLDAIPEIVRQIRLRDLGGIIIIDFIDMDERKNRNRVMAALEDELKSDRAPSKVLQFNDFGLVAITRKRVKQSLERTLSTTCGVCQGTGMVKSPITVCNDIYIEMRKMHRHLDRGDVMLRVHPEVVKQLKSSGAKWLQEMEEMIGKTILVKSDPGLHPEQFDIH
jgi:ribonuclease E